MYMVSLRLTSSIIYRASSPTGSEQKCNLHILDFQVVEASGDSRVSFQFLCHLSGSSIGVVAVAVVSFSFQQACDYTIA